ncbi:Peptide-N(4)-(N-acetyl-beta-glucosaminyl)asparagine amidase [Handroanthus impetiginosus]|uniref:Peptide-N(4)-(N-acetyl-beta-glucosaminyl)asparagine amidase n=1 Tax=Handroanthus impetiginosus TaxID=429701 RepID=A0A2G9G087_9LAMI|nr:Peptide-N(4)-(N-acetyl-beta-glucosaminyl)asparagine amidase [Handroanthus impetiginosus]
MVMGNEGNLQIVNQVINLNSSVSTKMPSSSISSVVKFKNFSLYLHSDDIDKGNRTYASIANVTLGFDEKKKKTSDFGSSTSQLKNLQNGQGYMLVKGNLVVSGLGSTQQEYRYNSDKYCYFRNVSSSNYTILHDEESNSCRYNAWLPSKPRWAVLGSKFTGVKKGLI